MMNTYVFEYLDENDFRKKERSVRKYNMLAYKKLTFNYYPELRKGTFLGKEVSRNDEDNTISYELELPTDELFKKVHGPIVLHYTVYLKKNIVLLTNITPEGIFDEGSKHELFTYKGVMISKSNPEKDMFKINLLNKVAGTNSSEEIAYLKAKYLSDLKSNSKTKSKTYSYREIMDEKVEQYARSNLSKVANLERKRKSLELLRDKFDDINEEIKNELYEKIYSSSKGEIRPFFEENKITNLDKIFSVYEEPNLPKKKSVFILCLFVIILGYFCVICGHSKISSFLWIVVLLLSIYVGVIQVSYYTSKEYKEYALRLDVYNFLDYYFSVQLLNYSLVYSVYNLDILETAKRMVLVELQKQKDMVKELLRMESYDENEIYNKLTGNVEELKSSSEIYDDLIEYFTEQIKSTIYMDTACTLDDVKKDVERWIKNI